MSKPEATYKPLSKLPRGLQEVLGNRHLFAETKPFMRAAAGSCFQWPFPDKDTCPPWSPACASRDTRSPNLWSRSPWCRVPCRHAWWLLFVWDTSSLSQGDPGSANLLQAAPPELWSP